MNRIRGIVVATLLAVWSFPAVSSARTPTVPAPQIEHAAGAKTAPPSASGDGESAGLAAREARSRELQSFRGGGVYIYVGSGVLLALVIVLLIVLLV